MCEGGREGGEVSLTHACESFRFGVKILSHEARVEDDTSCPRLVNFRCDLLVSLFATLILREKRERQREGDRKTLK